MSVYTAAVYAIDEEDLRILSGAYRDALDQADEEDYEITALSDLSELRALVQSDGNMSAVCVDARDGETVGVVEELRRMRADIAIVLVVDDTMSPRQYVRPSIMASSLIFYPIQSEDASNTFRELVAAARRGKYHSDEHFSLTAGGETRFLAYDDILFFESREKRVYVRTKHYEYAFYETLEHLETILPKQFARCHKGFIVNTRFLMKLNLSKRSLWLGEDIVVPISRSYKVAFKARKEVVL